MVTGKMKNTEVVIRFIFIVLFLVSFSSVSMGSETVVSDVYYCETEQYYEIRKSGGIKLRNLKFKFQYTGWRKKDKYGDRGKITFDGHPFDTLELDVVVYKNNNFIWAERFWDKSKMFYEDGVFYYSNRINKNYYVVIASCSIF